MSEAIRNLPASVHRRLLNVARAENKPFNELLQYFVLERFLFRLSQSNYRSEFILKGGLMFAVWQAPLARPTRDLDLLETGFYSAEELAKRVGEICQVSVVDDGLIFAVEEIQVTAIRDEEPYGGVRIRMSAYLGKAQVPVWLDIGVGDVVVPEPAAIEFPTLLDFPAPKLLGYSRESVIAEKTHALVRMGTLTSRMKDYYDLWHLSQTADFDGDVLSAAVEQTFRRRRTPIPGQLATLEPPFAKSEQPRQMWNAFLRRSRLDDAPKDFTQVVDQLRIFLLPGISALAKQTAPPGSWQAPGPWR